MCTPIGIPLDREALDRERMRRMYREKPTTSVPVVAPSEKKELKTND